MFKGFKAGRLVEALLETANWEDPEAQQALESLRTMGEKGASRVLAQMHEVSAKEYPKFIPLLARIISDANFPVIENELKNGTQDMTVALMIALAQGKFYNPNKLVHLFEVEEIPKPELIKAIGLQINKIDANGILRIMLKQDRFLWESLFKLLAKGVDDTMLPNMATQLRSANDPVFRMQMTRLIARFDTPQSAQILADLLQDDNRNIASVAMQALAKGDSGFDVRPLIHFLRGASGEMAEMATELLMRLNDPKTGLYISTLLLDSDEDVRDRAVNILARSENTQMIEMALESIKEGDWWLKERVIKAIKATDDPRLSRAMVSLLKAKDEFVRQTAIEVVDTESKESFEVLVKSLQDDDWLVQLRAIDALGKSGDQRAVPLLIDTAKQNAKSSTEVLKALAKLGNPDALPLCISLLEAKELAIQREALQTIESVVNEEHAESVRKALVKRMPKLHYGASTVAKQLIRDVSKKFNLTGTSALLDDADMTLAGEELSEEVREQLKQGSVTEDLERSETDAELIDPSKLKKGDIWQNRYEMERQIGKGAWGTVWLAEDTMVGEPLVLKFMNPEMALDKDAQKRFVRELRYARKVTNANVIRIFDFLAFADGTAISMEYFDSKSLAEELGDDRKPMPVKRALDIILKIADGMAAAHKEGVVHRDLKLANVLIRDDIVKVVDFGIAAVTRSVESTLTKAGSIVGTPVYVSPEQVLGKELDHRSDIYSLGIIMYQLLAGHPPYEGEPMSLLYQHVHGGAKPLHEENPEVPQQLSDLVAELMNTDRDKRIDSMEKLIERVNQLGL